MIVKENNRLLVIVLFVLSLLFSGCGSKYSIQNVSSEKLFQERHVSALNSNRLSDATRQALRLNFLTDQYKEDPAVVIRLIEEELNSADSVYDRTQLVSSIAEISLLEGKKLRKSDVALVKAMFLNAAAYSYDYLTSEKQNKTEYTLKPSYRFIANIYNQAVAQLISLSYDGKNKWPLKKIVKFGDVTYDFELVINEPYVWSPNNFDKILLANDIRIEGVRNEYFSKGLGAPVIGFVDNPRASEFFDDYQPKKNLAFSLTAFIAFSPMQEKDGGHYRKASIRFYDSLSVESIHINNQEIPLEADYSTPLGVMLAKEKASPIDGIIAMFNSENTDIVGITMLEAYREDKIPVLMVHGLMSSPITWVEMFNDLRGDPQLREKYQFWTFRYPTGLPIIYSGSLLRKELLAVQAKYDPEHKSKTFNNMVIVAHSMGGLLTRQMVQDSGSVYWDELFEKPIDEMDLGEKEKQILSKIFFFHPLPFVKRVVFLATPHKGSELADKWYAKLGASFIELPSVVTNTTDALLLREKNKSSLRKGLDVEKPGTGITLLSPSSHFIVATNKIPLDDSVIYHSIIGTRTVCPAIGSSDGVVPYWSSHIDNAVSEKLVPSGHSVQEHPIAIKEVKRILKLHAKEAGLD